jgi:hypothetical protein
VISRYGPWSRVRKVLGLGLGLDPADIDDTSFGCRLVRLLEHVGIGLHTDDLDEEPGQPHREDAWPAADIEQPPGAIEPQLLGERCLQLGRVRRAPRAVMRCSTEIDGGVVPHYDPRATRGPWRAGNKSISSACSTISAR